MKNVEKANFPISPFECATFGTKICVQLKGVFNSAALLFAVLKKYLPLSKRFNPCASASAVTLKSLLLLSTSAVPNSTYIFVAKKLIKFSSSKAARSLASCIWR